MLNHPVGRKDTLPEEASGLSGSAQCPFQAWGTMSCLCRFASSILGRCSAHWEKGLRSSSKSRFSPQLCLTVWAQAIFLPFKGFRAPLNEWGVEVRHFFTTNHLNSVHWRELMSITSPMELIYVVLVGNHPQYSSHPSAIGPAYHQALSSLAIFNVGRHIRGSNSVGDFWEKEDKKKMLPIVPSYLHIYWKIFTFDFLGEFLFFVLFGNHTYLCSRFIPDFVLKHHFQHCARVQMECQGQNPGQPSTRQVPYPLC